MLPKVIGTMFYAHKNLGGIMAGFGTWTNILKNMGKLSKKYGLRP